MPKARKKTKHLETPGKKEKNKRNEGEEIQEKAGKAKKSRTHRFIARLQRALAGLTGCMGRRKTPKKEKIPPSDDPGTTSSGPEDHKVHVTSEEKPVDGHDQILKTDGQEKDTLTTSYVDHQVLIHYTQDQICSHEDICDLLYDVPDMETPSIDVPGPESISPEDEKVHMTPERKDELTCYLEEQILLHHHQVQDQILSHEAIYTQYYGQQKMETPSIDVPRPRSISLEDGKEQISTERKEDPLYHMEEQILHHYQEVQDQTHFHEAIYVLYYWQQEAERPLQGAGRCHDKSKDHVCVEEQATTSTQQKKTATVPLTLKSFHFHTLLGKGGFGEVLLATDAIRKEHVAVKVVKKSFYIESGYGYSLAERDILHLSHENHYLVHGLAAFHTRCFVYYVMELATRGSLKDLIKKHNRLDFPTSRFITAEVVCGLQFLHGKGIIHCDLKPNNILLTGEGHIKVADFGLSKTNAFEGSIDWCRGTPGFAAPEMVMRLQYGYGVDFFSLGVTLYQMTIGYYPFCGSTTALTERDVVYKPPFFPGFLPRVTVQMLDGLLCKEPHNRLGVHGNIRNHPFFSDVNWADVENMTTVPPNIMVTVPEDVNLTENLCYKEVQYNIQSHNLFGDFSFVCPGWSDTYHPTNNMGIMDWMSNMFSKLTSRY